MRHPGSARTDRCTPQVTSETQPQRGTRVGNHRIARYSTLPKLPPPNSSDAVRRPQPSYVAVSYAPQKFRQPQTFRKPMPGTVKERLETCCQLWETFPAVLDRGAFRGSTRPRAAGNVFTSFGAFLDAVLGRATPLGTGSLNVYCQPAPQGREAPGP